MQVRTLRDEKELEELWRMEKELLDSEEDWEEIRRRYRDWPMLFLVVYDRGLLVGEMSGEASKMENDKEGLVDAELDLSTPPSADGYGRDDTKERLVDASLDPLLRGASLRRTEGVWIRGISVRENYQRQGWGGKLLEGFMSKATSFSEVVRVMPRDMCATAFYEKKGFKPVEVVLKTEKKQDWEADRLFRGVEEKDGLFVVSFEFEHGMEVKVKQEFEGEVKVVWELKLTRYY